MTRNIVNEKMGIKKIKSPCVSICRLRKGVCEGCGRTIDEIMDWPNMTNEQKLEVLQRIGDNNVCL